MSEARAREEICRVGRSLFERGYVHSTAGNISVRLSDGFLITPTDSCMGFLDPAELAHVDAQGTQIGGKRASKTLALHRRIYDATRSTSAPAACIVHTHSTHTVALTLRRAPRYFEGIDAELLAPITPYFVMKVGHVPVVPYGVPGSAAVANDVVSAIARYQQRGIELRAVMLERLGPTVWNTDPASTMATLEELEETARLAASLGDDCVRLTESEIDDLRKAFGARW